MATFTLVEGQSMLFVLRDISNPTERAKVDSPSYTYLLDLIGGTLSFWHSWIAGCTYKGRWREIVHRSALLLKLLTYAPTGAIIAAPTFGLPEEIGGLLNWDYRFTWIRDAAFTVYAFLRIGFKEEAVQFMEFIARRCMEIGTSEGSSSLQVLYDIRGKSPSAMICSYRARSHWYPEQVNPDLENVDIGGRYEGGASLIEDSPPSHALLFSKRKFTKFCRIFCDTACTLLGR